MRTAVPARTAADASASDAMPTSRAKWLSVPVGTTTSGSRCSAATAAAAATVPSPPATPIARTSFGGWVIRSASCSRMSAPGSGRITVARGQPAAISSVGSTPNPASGFTSTTSPSPAGIGGAAAACMVRAGTSGCSGHQCRVASAEPAPISQPAATSVGQCTPVCTREYPTTAASGSTTAPSARFSIATAVPKAAADAACPDGNEDDSGRLVSLRRGGSSSAAGRRRGNSGFPMRLADALAAPIAAIPRSAARRVEPARAAATAAMTNQSRL